MAGRARSFVILLSVFTLLLCALAAGAMLYQRHRTLADVTAQASAGAVFASAYTGRTYEVAAQSLRLADEYVAENGVGGQAVAAYLAKLTEQTSFNDYLIIVDADGDLLASSLPETPKANFADRPWFRDTRLHGGRVVGPIVRSRLNRDVIWTVSHPLRDSAGRFQGAVAIGVAAVGVLPTSARPPDASLATVWTTSGTMVASTFVDFAANGEAVPLPRPAVLDPARLSVRVDSRQITASAPVAGWPLIAVVSYDRKGVLARWRQEAAWTSLLVALVLAMSAALAVRTIQTERRERRAALELGLVLESVGDAFYALDREWRFLIFNGAAERYFGKDRADVIGKPFLEVIPAAAGTELEARFRKVMQTGEPDSFRFNSTAKPGRTADVRATRREDGGLTVTFTDVTEEARAATALAQSETMLRNITDAMPVLISYVDATQTFRFANKAYEARFGRPLSEIVGHSLQEVFGEEIYSARRPFVERALAGERLSYEIGFPDPADPRTTIVDHIPRVSQGGEVLGFYALVQDITELRRTEAQLRASEQRLKIATEASKIGVWEWVVGSEDIVLSERARRIWGFPLQGRITVEDVTGATHPEDRAFVAAQANRAMDPEIRDESPYSYRVETPAGVRTVHARATAIFERDADGERAVRYIGTVEDVTEAQAVRDDLERSEARLRLAIDAGRMAVWAVEPNGEVVVSPEFNRLLGLPADAKPTLAELRSRYYPGELERLQALSQETLARGETEIEFEYRHLWPNDEVHWLLVRAAFQFDTHGVPVGAIGVALDITDRKEDEERLQLLAREVDHRANNLMSVVQASMALTKGADVESYREALLGRVAALARSHQLLAKSRWQGAELRTLVDDELRAYQSADGQRVRVDGPSAVLEPAVAQAVGMLIHELATNAAKYGALSAPTGNLTVRWAADGDGWRLVWKESGGPVVTQPARRGTGMQVIERSLRGKGSADVHWDADGLECQLVFPRGPSGAG